MNIIPEAYEAYASQYSSPEPDVLQELNRDTQAKVLRPRMLSGHLQGRFLSFISRMLRPRLVLDIGTYTGYSSICLAEGLQAGGTLHTIDHNPELENFARHYMEKAGMGNLITQHIGEALDILPQLDGVFDLVFIDADKENYVRYFEMIYPKLRDGGIIIADNVLWSGKVMLAHDQQDEETRGIVRFNEYISKHEGLRHMLLPVRDGLMLMEKVGNSDNKAI